MLTEQAARLRVVEQQLGLTTQPTRPFGQGGATGPPQQTAPTQPEATPPHFSVTDDATAQSTHATPPSALAADSAGSNEHAATDARAAYRYEAGTQPATQATDTTAHAPYATQGARASSSADVNAPAAAVVSKAWGDLEARIGGRWFNWLGIIAVVLGIGFFLKLAFDKQWITPMGRVLLGSVAGCAILALAERLRLRGYQAYAYVLSGGGILILYLSVYAAFGFYQLIPQPVAFGLMALVTATAVVLAARYDAYAIAILGLIGGFMTPKLLATSVDNEIGLFGYAALLDGGVLALAYFKRWRSLNHLAFLATWLLFAGWSLKFYVDAKLWLTLFFLTLFFVMFAALPIIHNVLKQRPARWFDVSLILTNATLYFGTSYLLLDDHRQLVPDAFAPQGPHALLLAGFFVLLYFIVRQRHPTDKLLTYTYVAAAVTFCTMAIAIQLDQLWVTIGWAVEALMLTWLGLKAHEDAPRFAALPVFAFALLHWFTVDMPDYGYRAGAQFWPLLNKRSVSCAALVIVCASIVWLYHRYSERVHEDDRDILTGLFILAGNALALTLLTVDLNDYFYQRIDQANGYLLPAAVANTHQFALSILWLVYGTAAFVIGLRLRHAIVRYGALAWLAYTGAKIMLVDARYYNATWHAPIFNQTAAAFALFVCALWLVARLYAHADDWVAKESRRVLPIVMVVANLFALTGLSLEASGYFAAQRRAGAVAAGQLHDLRLAQQLALSVLWALYGGAMLVVGLARRNRLLRLMALTLLGGTTLKVFLFDLSSLDKVYRIISFIVLGAILLAVSFLYQQRQQRTAKAEGG
jgi:uncharacterized membrane protein